VTLAVDDAQIAALIERRRKVRLWWAKDGGAPGSQWDQASDGRPPVGLALSGGGIRSATFSLGLIQALAKSSRDAFGRIDVLSTVSGGGYAGCFLRSLFVPAALRGIAPESDTADLAAKADQYRLARAALAGDPCERELAWPPGARSAMRNPMWWLREHSRYLAPTGMTDYGYAAAYIARNWLAMAYLVVLACVALGALLVGAEAGMLALTGWDGFDPKWGVPVSPLLALAALPVAASSFLMIGYWATQAMSTNEPLIFRQRTSLRKAAAVIVGGALAAVVVLVVARAIAAAVRGEAVHSAFATIIGGGAIVSITGAGIAWAVSRTLDGALLTSELRRTLTGALATSNGALLLIVVVALLDSLGAWLADWLPSFSLRGGLGAAMLPVLAFLIKKLPDWFGGGARNGGGIGGLLKRFAKTSALVAGVLLYAILAVASLALVHATMWHGPTWSGTPHWTQWTVLTLVACMLAWLLGWSTGFINLSSLHSLYASRLTRAYLGASNVQRLEQVLATDHQAPINENHPRDYIQPRIYGGTDLPAPIHVINVTLNETIDPRSQIVARDRKGDLLSVEPDGVRVGARLTPWASLIAPDLPKDRRAENISLGQWIAISGAAASSGMGRMSSLGFALAFTFANVRLGYWWWSPNLCPDTPVVKGVGGWIARNFGTFVYLLNEMTCRYSRGYFRKYLTDGGHYENSGAYVLIRRRVPLILVTDNGADPLYAFADLETLVRQVRIDLGGETTILGGLERDAFLTGLGATGTSIFVDPAAPDWRARMLDPADPAYVLVLRVVIAADTLHMLWIKPRLLPGVPTDVAGYQSAMPAFPQQPTGDQFFDEAQWESYRRLGELSMTRLLDTCPGLLA
jgi:hypothetical protein